MYIRYFQDDTVDIFRVYLKPGVSAWMYAARDCGATGKIATDLRDAESRGARVHHQAENQWFGMTYLQVFVALIVAMLGIVNTLTVSIADRRRELGVLRAVGGLRKQIRGTIWLEAAAIGVIGLVLGVVTGRSFSITSWKRSARILRACRWVTNFLLRADVWCR